MQQDAHEFLNFLINHISEIILGKLNIKVYLKYYWMGIKLTIYSKKNLATLREN